MPAAMFSREQPVNLGAQAGRALGVAGEGVNRGLDVGHQQSGGDSLADDIGDADAEAMAAQPEHVVVIAAHRARGQPGRGNLEARNLRNLARQQRALYLLGALPIPDPAFKPASATFHRMLELGIASLQPLFRGVVQKRGNTDGESNHERELPSRDNQVGKR